MVKAQSLTMQEMELSWLWSVEVTSVLELRYSAALEVSRIRSEWLQAQEVFECQSEVMLSGTPMDCTHE